MEVKLQTVICHCIIHALAGSFKIRRKFCSLNKINRNIFLRNSKQLIAQLMRIHVVTPKAPVNVTLNPRVQPAPNSCPVFVTGIQEPVRLSQSSYWILRLPYPFSSKIIFEYDVIRIIKVENLFS